MEIDAGLIAVVSLVMAAAIWIIWPVGDDDDSRPPPRGPGAPS